MNLDRIAMYLFVASITFGLTGAAYVYGVFSHRDGLFPYPQLNAIQKELRELLNPPGHLLLNTRTKATTSVESANTDVMQDGLIVVAGSINGARDTFVKLIDRKGTVHHEWRPVWGETWPEVSGRLFASNAANENFPIDRLPRGNKHSMTCAVGDKGA